MHTKRFAPGPLAACLLAAVSLLVACGDSEDDSLSAACQSYDGFDSYRYSITVKMDVPPLETAPDAAPGTALSAYADSLSALLSDFKVEGAYVAPDRRQAILDFRGDQVELREVGDERWERFRGTWEEATGNTPDVENLSPESVCTDLVMGLAPGLAPSGPEQDVGGVRAQRYTINNTSVDNLGELLGLEPGAKLPAFFLVDVWLATDGGWPVRLEVQSQTAVAQEGAGAVEFIMALRDVNDPAIEIEPPVLAAAP
jgi:hypothetical protein